MKTKIFFVYIFAVVNALGYVDHIHVSKTRDPRTAISSRFQIFRFAPLFPTFAWAKFSVHGPPSKTFSS